jgi:hypothetical protein
MVKMNSLVDKTTISKKNLGRNTRLLPELWEKSRNKIGRRTQMKEKILSIDSAEVIPQSHVSFCRLMQAFNDIDEKRNSEGGALAKKPCHSSPASKPEEV